MRRLLEIEATLRKRTYHFQVAAGQFTSMNWPMEHLGAGAALWPGFGTKDHARAAIQFLSGDPPERKVYAHLGWREIDSAWYYMHAGGAIGPVGPVMDVEVSLASDLSRFQLPEPPPAKDLVEAVRASLGLLKVAGDSVTVPLYCGLWRAALGQCATGLHLVGTTGGGKTELAALAQQHYGAEMGSRNLPGSWLSIPDFGVTAPMATAAPATRTTSTAPTAVATSAPAGPRRRRISGEPIGLGTRYRVREGDSVSGIAERIENRPGAHWPAVMAIFNANPDAFIDNDPDVLILGSWLDIPDFGVTVPLTVADRNILPTEGPEATVYPGVSAGQAAEQPVSESVVDESAFDETVVDESAFDETVVDETVVSEPVVSGPVDDEPIFGDDSYVFSGCHATSSATTRCGSSFTPWPTTSLTSCGLWPCLKRWNIGR